MAFLRRRSRLDEAGRAALIRVLEAPTFELIPLKNADDQAGHLPAGATVSVTASPAKGQMATAELSLRLHDRGLRVVPHLSARLTRDREELLAFLTPLRDAGIDRLFVVGGDPEEPGAYPDALSILREMADLGVLPVRDRDRLLSAGPPVHLRRRARGGPRREGAVRVVHDDPAVLRSEGDLDLDPGSPGGRDLAARSSSGSRRSPRSRSSSRSPPGSGSATPPGSS